MRIKLHSNGWTPIIENYDVTKATPQEITVIAKLLYTNTIVVFTNQSLTPNEEAEFCYKFGDTQSYSEVAQNCVSNDHLDILRVTGNKKNTGAFPSPDELEWHLNKSANLNKKNIVYLYGVKGTFGSRTSWINSILAYQDLHHVVKKDIDSAKIKLVTFGENFVDQINGSIHKKITSLDQLLESGDGSVIAEQLMPIVHTNILGVKGLYWPSRMVYAIDEDPLSGKPSWSESRSKEMIELLHNHVFQEKYMYHHDWNDGDLVLSEQFLGVHKRWPFPGIEYRLLHRIEFDTSKITFN